MSPAKYIIDFKSVKISHDIIHRIDYSYLAEFFRFMGILVCEEILIDRLQNRDDRTEIERRTKYSAHIYVGERKLNADEERKLGIPSDEYENLLGKLPEQTIYLYSNSGWPMTGDGEEMSRDVFSRKLICRLSQRAQKRLMNNLLAEILGVAFADQEQGQDIANQLQELINIYVEDKIWLHSMNLQYYRKKKSDAAADAKEAFLKSHEKVKKLLEAKSETSVGHWYKYAWIWCEMKVDTACDYEDNILYFSIDKIVERCEAFIQAYPWFSNGKILLGLCYEPAVSRTNEALLAFANAIKDIREECFSAPVYYWMGKRYEAYPGYRGDAKKCYSLAEESKSKFRSIFKLAVFARDAEDFDKSIELFNRIIEKLSVKMRLNFIDPLEFEYIFKAYAQLGYVYNKVGEDAKAVKNANMAKSIRNKSIDNNKYFDVFYGKHANSYRNILKDRLNLEIVEWLIKDSNRKCYQRI